MPAGGRPSKLHDADTRDLFIDAIASGFTQRGACAVAGISEDTAIRYRKLCEESLDPWECEFHERLQEAHGKALVMFEKTVISSGKSDPRTAMKILARRHPEGWSEYRRPKTVIRIDKDLLRKGASSTSDGHLGVELLDDGDADE